MAHLIANFYAEQLHALIQQYCPYAYITIQHIYFVLMMYCVLAYMYIQSLDSR